MIENTPDFLLKILKFGAVGSSGLIIDFSLTYIGKEKLGIQKYLSNAIGFCTAATSNYFLNRWWTFTNHNPEVAGQLGSFFLIALAGLIMNTWIIWLTHQKRGMNFFVAKALAIAVVMFWNFLMNFFFTFGE